jgi:hypothetical protein
MIGNGLMTQTDNQDRSGRQKAGANPQPARASAAIRFRRQTKLIGAFVRSP